MGWVEIWLSGMAAVIVTRICFLLALEIIQNGSSRGWLWGSSRLLGWLVWLPGRCVGQPEAASLVLQHQGEITLGAALLKKVGRYLTNLFLTQAS